MLSQAKVLYQVKLILDYLPEEEYKLIPQEMIDYIEDNFEYDENFSIDPEIPLEKQKIDDKAFEMLDKIVRSAEITKKENKSIKNAEIDSYLKEIRESNQNYNARIENIRLKNLVEILKKENIEEWDIEEFEELRYEYKIFTKNIQKEIGNIDATYGVKGIASAWSELSGGARQFVMPLNGNIMKTIGILYE